MLPFLLVVVHVLASGERFEVASENRLSNVPSAYLGGHAYGGISPDGKSIAIVKGGALSVQVFGSQAGKQLLPAGTLTQFYQAWAAWSPDEKWIYYLKPGVRFGVTDLWKVGVERSVSSLVVKDAGGIGTGRPMPLPNGRDIVISRGKSILLVGTDGRNERVLCDQCEGASPLACSPDGSQILYRRNSHGRESTLVTLVTLATGETKALAPFQGWVLSGYWPAWSSGPFLAAATSLGKPGYPDSFDIWHLSLTDDERTHVTHDDGNNYLRILGAGPDRYSLVTMRSPRPNGWREMQDSFDRFLINLGWKEPQFTVDYSVVVLNLRKTE